MAGAVRWQKSPAEFIRGKHFGEAPGANYNSCRQLCADSFAPLGGGGCEAFIYAQAGCARWPGRNTTADVLCLLYDGDNHGLPANVYVADRADIGKQAAELAAEGSGLCDCAGGGKASDSCLVFRIATAPAAALGAATLALFGAVVLMVAMGWWWRRQMYGKSSRSSSGMCGGGRKKATRQEDLVVV